MDNNHKLLKEIVIKSIIIKCEQIQPQTDGKSGYSDAMQKPVFSIYRGWNGPETLVPKQNHGTKSTRKVKEEDLNKSP